MPVGERARVSHQRIDQDALVAPVAKWSATLGVRGAAETVEAALALAAAPPQGPVHLAFSPDAPRADPPQSARSAGGRRERAIELLAASRAPLIAVGVGARHAAAPLRAAARRTPLARARDVQGAGPRGPAPPRFRRAADGRDDRAGRRSRRPT